METAGLDFNRLAGLLERVKIQCTLVDGDHAEDHCLLCILSVDRPRAVAYLGYINQGAESRTLSIRIDPAASEQRSGSYFSVTEETLRLKGVCRDDPEKIVGLVKKAFFPK